MRKSGTFMSNKKNVVIFDLDGTLALIDHRRHLVTDGSSNWSEFHKQCVNDQPNLPVIKMLQALTITNAECIIVSGRSEDVREETLTWLRKYVVNQKLGILMPRLIMRPSKNYTPDDELKMQWLNDGTLPNINKILCVYDDRDRVVKAWRNAGLCCFQVAEGNF